MTRIKRYQWLGSCWGKTKLRKFGGARTTHLDESTPLQPHFIGKTVVDWDGNGLAYPRIGYVSDRFQTSFRPVSDRCQTSVMPDAQSMSQWLLRHTQSMSLRCTVMSRMQKSVLSDAQCHFGCTVLTEIHGSGLKVVPTIRAEAVR